MTKVITEAARGLTAAPTCDKRVQQLDEVRRGGSLNRRGRILKDASPSRVSCTFCAMESRLEEFGLRCWHGSIGQNLLGSHVHNELEANLVLRGRLVYLLAGRRITVEEGQFALFWAAVPHQVIWCQDPTDMAWITIPLSTFLGWDLPRPFQRSILAGQMLLEPDPAQAPADARLLARWDAAVNGGAPLQQRAFLLQLEARLCELALALNLQDGGTAAGQEPAPEGSRPETAVPIPGGPDLGRVERMTAFVAANYTRPLTVTEIGRAAGLTANYASELFRGTYGCGLVEFVLRTRLAHAQRLLVSSNKTVLDVALEAGFGSSARFHAAFSKTLGTTPAAYRRNMRPR